MPVEIPVNIWAILACGVMSLALGFVWYGPLFGKKYLKYVGVTEADIEKFKSDPKAKMRMNMSYGLTFVIACITAFVLQHVIVFGNAYTHMSGLSGALQGAAWSWLGFYVPSVAGGVFWENKKWGWFVLVAGYYLIQLLLMGVILSLWV
jgi:hypothetical protein